MAGSLGYLFKGKTKTEVAENGAKVLDLVKGGKLRFTDPTKSDERFISLRDVAESTLGDELHKHADGDLKALRRVVATGVSESTEGIMSTNFQDITQALVLQATLQQYRQPAFIREQLFTFEQTRDENMREIGLADIDAKVLVVPEGTEYPEVKYGEDYIDFTKPLKRGAKIGVSREMIFRDRTGDVTKKALQVGKIMGEDIEDRCLNTIIAASAAFNTFKRKGVARNTFVSATDDPNDPRINKLIANNITDWTSFDAVQQAFIAMRDDRTPGQPIAIDFNTILVSAAKLWTVNRILHATEVRTNAPTAAATPYPITQTTGPNPLSRFGVISSPRLDYLLALSGQTASAAKEFWWAGDFKSAFVYRQFFPFDVRSATPNDTDDFERDIVLKFRASEMGEAGVRAPWNVIENAPA